MYNNFYFIFVFAYIERCPTLINPSNGHVNYNNTTFSSLAYYSCNAGYKIIEVKILRCIKGRLWNNTPASCQGLVLFEQAA